MSQITKLKVTSGPGSGTVTSVSGGNNITITGVPTVNPTVNVSGTTNHAVQVGNALGALTSIPVGLTGQVLTGVTGADPVFAAPASSSISITGDSGGALTGNAFTFTGGTTGLTFSGAGTTETITGTLVVANGGTGRATLTNHGLLVGAGTAAITQLADATNGQLPIGSTGADPVLATLTAGTGITITNGAGSITISSGSAVSESFPTDTGTATPSAGVLNIFGDSHNVTTTGSGNTVHVGLTGITQHSIQVGGASEALTQLGVATNGQLPIGSTGADPVLAAISSGNNITVTNGAGSISVAVTGTTNHTLQIGNASGSLTSLAAATNGQLAIGSTGADPVIAALTAGTGITVTNGAGSITISATGTTTLTVTSVNHAASPYTVLSTDEFLAVNVSGGVVSILLPNAPVTGRVYYIKDSTGGAATSNITVTTVGGAVNIDGATSFVMNTAYESISVIFDGSAYEVF